MVHADLLKNKWLVPWILGLSFLMEALDTTVLNTALPQMAMALSINLLTLKLAIVSYVVTLAAFLPLSGYVSDRFGTQKVFFIAVVIFVSSSLLCGASQNLTELVVGRLLQGIGGAMVTPVARLMLLKTFERSEFIKAFNFLVIVGQIGVALGPTLGGIVTTTLGWRWMFFINLPTGLILLVLSVYFIPNYIETKRYAFDRRGFFLFSMAMSTMTFGLALMTETGWGHTLYAMALIGLGGVFFLLYFWHAQYVSRPLLNFLLLKKRTFRLSFLGAFISRLPINAPLFLLTLLLQVVFGFSALKAGLCLIPYGLSMALTRTFFIKIAQSFGYRRCLITNSMLTAGTLFLFSGITLATPLWVILLLLGVMGMFTSFQFSGMNSLAFADIEPQDIAQASLISGVFQQFSMSLSVCVAAGLLSTFGYVLHSNALSLRMFHLSFAALSVVMLSSLFAFCRLRAGDGDALLSKRSPPRL